MRAVCRTLQQCHLRNILHRDIKPGNFMLLSDDEGAPLKAIGAPQRWPCTAPNPVAHFVCIAPFVYYCCMSKHGNSVAAWSIAWKVPHKLC